MRTNTHWFPGFLHLSDAEVFERNDASRLLILVKRGRERETQAPRPGQRKGDEERRRGRGDMKQGRERE